MDIFTIFFIAISLSFDTFAVAASSGIFLKDISFKNATKIAFTFAFFEGSMPVIGWLAGTGLNQYIAHIHYWIAFGLLTIIGLKMIIDSLKHKSVRQQINPLNIKFMVSMSIATSIDALIIGISFAFIKINILTAVIMIGAVSFIASMLGILFGKKVGKHLGKNIEIIGGLMLIGIGVKILLENIL